MTAQQAKALLAAVIAARATSFMFSKILVGTMAPFNILAVRFLLAALLLAVVFRRRLRDMSWRIAERGAVIGTAFFATMALEMLALTGASSSTVSFLENTAIVFVPVAMALVGRRLPPRSSGIACVVALAGVGLLTLGGSAGSDSPAGALLGLGSGLAYTVAIIVTARLSREDDALLLGIVQVAVMGLLSLGAMLVFEKPSLPFSAAEWEAMAVLIVVCTGFGFTLQPVAQSRVSADDAALLCALSPLVAAILGAIFLAEPVTAPRLAGMALIAASMLAASRPPAGPKDDQAAT